jgi:hypothetical protein
MGDERAARLLAEAARVHASGARLEERIRQAVADGYEIDSEWLTEAWRRAIQAGGDEGGLWGWERVVRLNDGTVAELDKRCPRRS